MDITVTYIVVALISIIVSLVAHEFMHAYTGHLLGDTTARDEGRLTLNPLAHIDPFMTVLLPLVTLVIYHAPVLAAKPVPFNPARVKFDEFGAALIALAGPLTNLALAFIGAVLAHHIFGFGTFGRYAFEVFESLNVALFVFNLLPIPPLDGSRVLYAVAPEPLQNLMRAIEPYGLFIVFALVLTFGLGNSVAGIEQSLVNLLP